MSWLRRRKKIYDALYQGVGTYEDRIAEGPRLGLARFMHQIFNIASPGVYRDVVSAVRRSVPYRRKPWDGTRGF